MECNKTIIYEICDECKLTEQDVAVATARQIIKTLGIKIDED